MERLIYYGHHVFFYFIDRYFNLAIAEFALLSIYYIIYIRLCIQWTEIFWVFFYISNSNGCFCRFCSVQNLIWFWFYQWLHFMWIVAFIYKAIACWKIVWIKLWFDWRLILQLDLGNRDWMKILLSFGLDLKNDNIILCRWVSYLPVLIHRN